MPVCPSLTQRLLAHLLFLQRILLQTLVKGGGVTPPTNVVVSPRVWGVSMLGGDLRTGPDSNSPIVQALLGENLNAVYPVTRRNYERRSSMVCGAHPRRWHRLE